MFGIKPACKSPYDLYNVVDTFFGANYDQYNIFNYAWMEDDEEDKNIYKVKLPGIAKEDVILTFTESDRLMNVKVRGPKDTYKYDKYWRLPNNTKVAKAEMKHGLLTINLESITPDKEKPKAIEIV